MPGLSPAIAVLAAAIAGMTWAAAHTMKTPSMIAAAIGAIAVIALSASTNARFRTPAADALMAARLNAGLIALVYAWGGLAMLSVYLWSGLYWRHGWHYGSGMLLIAAAIFAYTRALAKPASGLAEPHALSASALLTAAQGIAATFALLILTASGKLATFKGDWAANHIFMASGLAIILVSLLAYLTHRRLSR